MTCDRAQELFSDYIEGALDQRLAISMDAHLAGCLACKRENDALRATWEDLDALPVISPPPELVAQTLAAIHREREAMERVALQPAPWLAWLRSLSPMRVALGTSLATLLIVGAYMFPRTPEQPLGHKPFQPEVQPPPVRPASAQPRVTVTIEYGKLVGETQNVTVIVVSDRLLKDAEVTLQRSASREFIPLGQGTMQAGTPYPLSISLLRGRSAEPLLVDVTSAPARYEKHFYCVIPFERPGPREPVSLTLVETRLDEALKQLAEQTGRPVVVDTALAAIPVTAKVVARPAGEAWGAVLAPLKLRAIQRGESYEVVPKE